MENCSADRDGQLDIAGMLCADKGQKQDCNTFEFKEDELVSQEGRALTDWEQEEIKSKCMTEETNRNYLGESYRERVKSEDVREIAGDFITFLNIWSSDVERALEDFTKGMEDT